MNFYRGLYIPDEEEEGERTRDTPYSFPLRSFRTGFAVQRRCNKPVSPFFALPSLPRLRCVHNADASAMPLVTRNQFYSR